MVRRLLFLLAVAVVVAPALTQERPKGDKPDVAGKMNYDKQKKTLVVTPPRGEPVKLAVDKGTEIVIDGKRGAIGAIPDNHPVRVYLGPGGKVVRRLFAEGPTQTRKVLAVNEARRAIQLERETDTEEVPVAADATIVVNGRDAKITDVEPGETATIRFAIDKKTILAIRVGLDKPVEGKIPRKD
jgi:hypothetical protein